MRPEVFVSTFLSGVLFASAVFTLRPLVQQRLQEYRLRRDRRHAGIEFRFRGATFCTPAFRHVGDLAEDFSRTDLDTSVGALVGNEAALEVRNVTEAGVPSSPWVVVGRMPGTRVHR